MKVLPYFSRAFETNGAHMAMEATHIRFARDLKVKLEIVDLNEYYAGAIYPVSRYVTGLDREVTHSASSDPFDPSLSDFEKGWATHLLYDTVAGEMQRALIPEELNEDDVPQQWWIYFSAIKLIEDITSFAALGEDAQVFQRIGLRKGPLNEDPEMLLKYYQAQATLYANQPDVAAYRNLFTVMGLDAQVAQELNRTVNTLRANEALVAEIHETYRHVLKRVLPHA